MNNRRLKMKFLFLGLPSFAGFVVLYLYPFVRTLWYSGIDNTFRKNFVFFDNYVEVLSNQYYQLAIWNTFTFSLVGTFCIVSLSILFSFGLLKLGWRFSFAKNLVIAPMILPTASVVFVWQIVFQNNEYLSIVHDASVGSGILTVLPVFLLFIWKNMGINVIIISASLASIPSEVSEAASLDGAFGFRLYRKVMLPMISPSIFFVGALSFVNSLKNFRESYLFFGTNYPPDAAYTLQYYMNNQFQRLNYPRLTAGSVMFTLLISIILFVVYYMENKYNDKIY